MDEEFFLKSQVCAYIGHVRRRRKNKNPNTLSTEHSLIARLMTSSPICNKVAVGTIIIWYVICLIFGDTSG